MGKNDKGGLFYRIDINEHCVFSLKGDVIIFRSSGAFANSMAIPKNIILDAQRKKVDEGQDKLSLVMRRSDFRKNQEIRDFFEYFEKAGVAERIDLEGSPRNLDRISVDAGNNLEKGRGTNPGYFKCRGINNDTGEIIFSKDLGWGTNNTSEFIGIMMGIWWCYEVERKKCVIYSDSKIAMNWIEKRYFNTSLVGKSGVHANISCKKAIKWLNNNPGSSMFYDLRFWNKKRKGKEIPADYGHKFSNFK